MNEITHSVNKQDWKNFAAEFQFLAMTFDIQLTFLGCSILRTQGRRKITMKVILKICIGWS